MLHKIRISPVFFGIFVVITSIMSENMMTFNFFVTLALLGDILADYLKLPVYFEFILRGILITAIAFSFFYFTYDFKVYSNTKILDHIFHHTIYGYVGCVLSFFVSFKPKKKWIKMI